MERYDRRAKERLKLSKPPPLSFLCCPTEQNETLASTGKDGPAYYLLPVMRGYVEAKTGVPRRARGGEWD